MRQSPDGDTSFMEMAKADLIKTTRLYFAPVMAVTTGIIQAVRRGSLIGSDAGDLLQKP